MIFSPAILTISLANAEVYHCIHPETGRKYFTDRQCPDNSIGSRVHVGEANIDSGYSSTGEIRAAELERRAEKLRNELRTKKMVAAASKHTPKKSDSDRRVEAYQKPKSSNPYPMTIPSVPKPPPVIVNHDPAGAWDTGGNRYTKGAGTTYFRSDGKVCQQLNTGMQCN